MNVYTKDENGNLMMWTVATMDYAEAIALVREVLPLDHKQPVLAVVK